MKLQVGSRSGAADSAPLARPPLIWWAAHAIAGFGIGGLFLIWGMSILNHGAARIPPGFRTRLVLEDSAATLFAWAIMLVCPAMIAHGFLTCFDRVKPWAEMAAKVAAGLALLLIIGALLSHVIG